MQEQFLVFTLFSAPRLAFLRTTYTTLFSSHSNVMMMTSSAAIVRFKP